MIVSVKDKLDLCDTRLHFFFGKKGAKSIEKLYNLDVDGDCGCCAYSHDYDGYSVLLIYIDTTEDETTIIQTIAHEALHGAIDIWHTKGANLDHVKNSEVLCYTTDCIVGKCWEAYKLWKRYLK